MKAPSTKIRFAEATKLLDYGFANYSCQSFGNKGDIVTSTNVNKGVKNSVNLVLEKDAGILVKKGTSSNIVQNVNIKENISAPIKEGDCLGTINYVLENEQLLEVNLLAETDIEKNTIWNLTTSLYVKWFNMLR